MSSIIRMSPDQLRRVKALIKNQCCNYMDGDCLLLDCPCPQIITYSLLCKWCRTAVLPNNTELFIQLIRPEKSKRCAICGNKYVYRSNREKYCRKCKHKAELRRKARYREKQRQKRRLEGNSTA